MKKEKSQINKTSEKLMNITAIMTLLKVTVTAGFKKTY